ncbi:MAG: CopD family protein [Proteobacteria bacterium]|nr:CopD family protein [Pseudomonadota bacterium]
MMLFKLIHLLSVVVWVGGMFFAYVVLRPAIVEILEPPQRLRLWDSVFRRFFNWVWLAIGALLISGLYMIALYGGMAHVGSYVHAMLMLGLVMIAIYGHVFFGLYRKFSQLVAAQNWKEAGEMLGRIRKLVAVNLSLGLLTMGVALIGMMWG